MTFGKLIKQEWIKLQSTRSLIFLIVCLFINALIVWVSLKITDVDPKAVVDEEMLATMNPFAILLGGFSGVLAVIASLFFIMQYGDEYKHGLIRKNVIDGMDRKDIFNGKMLFLFGSYFIWTVLLVLTFLIGGGIKFGGNFGIFLSSIQIEQLIKYYLHITLYGALAFCLVSLTRSSTTSIIILFGIYIVDIIAGQVLPLFDMKELVDYLPTQIATLVRSEDNLSVAQKLTFLTYLFVLIAVGQLSIYKRDL